MSAGPVNLGQQLADNLTVYRAFSIDGYRDRKSNRVRPRAYYRKSDHDDGISLGKTPAAAVALLDRNFGYCSVVVGEVHALPHNLRILEDLSINGHALLRNLPPIDGTNEERELAEFIAGRLAKLSKVETCDPYYPPLGQVPPPL